MRRLITLLLLLPSLARPDSLPDKFPGANPIEPFSTISIRDSSGSDNGFALQGHSLQGANFDAVGEFAGPVGPFTGQLVPVGSTLSLSFSVPEGGWTGRMFSNVFPGEQFTYLNGEGNMDFYGPTITLGPIGTYSVPFAFDARLCGNSIPVPPQPGFCPGFPNFVAGFGTLTYTVSTNYGGSSDVVTSAIYQFVEVPDDLFPPVKTPEPTTLSLMIAGLLGFAILRFPALCRCLDARANR